MKRDGGVIHSIIHRLTNSSTAEERETYPTFTPSDFEVPLTYLQPNRNALDVIEFAEDLAEEPETRELAAQVLKTALKDAISAMTGLKGNDLLTIFTEIRRQLGPDRELVVLIEDVTIIQLNVDVINAFERREGDDLCRMIAVLGIADLGWSLLQTNQQGRATHLYEVGGQTVQQWVANPGEIAKFTARYLNAVRSTQEGLQDIAEDRFKGDIRRSHCEKCEYRPECHAAFGKVVFEDGAEVGMFPFSKHAPYALLQHLPKNHHHQRGFLEYVLLSTLDRSYDNLQRGRFPRQDMFSVSPPSLTIWAGFENRYCSGGAWDSEQKARLKFLAQLWIPHLNAEEMAAALQPLLKPLGLPAFPSKPTTVVKPPSNVTSPVVTKTSVPPAPAPPTDSELKRLLELLDTWFGGQPLREDSKFRDLLGALLSQSIVWEDHQEVSIKEKKRLVGGNTVPKIEGQVANPRGSYNVNFPRDQETHDLLQGLLMLSRSRDKTWNFPDGELHKRAVSRWLRKHQAKVIESMQPESPSIVQESLRAAVQALALTALLRDHKKLPEGRADRIAAIFTSRWLSTARPVVMSEELDGVVADLEFKNPSLREFLVNELGAGQGDADPKDFINPIPILRLLTDFEKRFQFDPPPPATASSFWGPRFEAVKAFSSSFASFRAALEKEQKALGEATNTVRTFVEEAGFATEDLRTGLETCLSELVPVIEFQRKPNILPLVNDHFDELWKKKYLQTTEVRASWGANVSRSLELSAGKSLSEVAAFNGTKLKECLSSLRIVAHQLDLVDQELTLQEQQVGPQGDSREQLLEVLGEIAALLETGEKGEADSE
jgi:hypothetical protein